MEHDCTGRRVPIPSAPQPFDVASEWNALQPDDARMKRLTSIAVQDHNGVSVVRLSGDIDTSNISEVGDSLGSIALNHGMIIDLSEVSYLNRATVKLLFDLSERMRKARQQLRLVMAEAAPLRTLFQALKFDLVVPLHASIEDALQSCATTKP